MEVFDALAKYEYPAVSGLTYRNQFTFLVGILLSAQSRDEFINTQTPALFDRADNAQAMFDLGVEEIALHIQKIGLWRNKAKNIHLLSKKIIEFQEILANQQNKEWYSNLAQAHEQRNLRPVESDDLTSYDDDYISKEGIPTFRLGLVELPGIGRKSANVFLNVMYDAPCFPVDTHVIRLTNRLDIAHGNPVEIEEILQEIVPKKYTTTICHSLVWHGRRVCTAKKPDCKNCMLKEYCKFFNMQN